MSNLNRRRDVIYRAHAGEDIDHVLDRMITHSQKIGSRVICSFNDIQVIVSPETTKEEAKKEWETTLNHRQSPFKQALYERQRDTYQREAEAKKRRVHQLLAEDKMEVPWYKLYGYLRTCWAQQDNLSKETLRFAQAWAIAMQHEIRKGNKPANVMDTLEQELDFVGLSGFAYNIAKSFLKKFWKYGNQLP